MTPPATLSTEAAPVNSVDPVVVAVGLGAPVPVGCTVMVPFIMLEGVTPMVPEGIGSMEVDGAAFIELDGKKPLQSPPLQAL